MPVLCPASCCTVWSGSALCLPSAIVALPCLTPSCAAPAWAMERRTGDCFTQTHSPQASLRQKYPPLAGDKGLLFSNCYSTMVNLITDPKV